MTTQATKKKTKRDAPQGFWFWTPDFMKDTANLSDAAVGVWARMLCMMSESKRRGVLTFPSGEPYLEADLRTLSQNWTKVKAEFRRFAVPQFAGDDPALDAQLGVDDLPKGAIYSRRMVRDTKIKFARSGAAKKRWDEDDDGLHGDLHSKDDANQYANGDAKRMQKPKVASDLHMQKDMQKAGVLQSFSPSEHSTTDHSGFRIVADSARDDPENPPESEPIGPEVQEMQRLLSGTLAKMRGGEEAHRKLGYPDEAIARQCLAAAANRIEKILDISFDLRREQAPESWGWFPKVFRERAQRDKT